MKATRRGFLTAAGLAGLGIGVGVAGDRAVGGTEHSAVGGAGNAVPFYGLHQAGVATPTPQHLQFGSFDLLGGSRDDLRDLLSRWSGAAAALSSGRPVGPLETGDSAPVDTGEAVGLGPSALTITFGLGPSLFSAAGNRFAVARSRPAPLVDLPSFAGEQLDPGLSGGDLAVQVCADDPQVAFHALHDLIRIASGVAVPRWVLAGFGSTSNSRAQQTPRNLMGFRDGTNNIMVEDQTSLERFVWARGGESPAWMVGGSYMVVRRVRMLLGAWDATSLNDQEQTFGRYKISGAPLGEAHEHDPVNLKARAGGLQVVAADAHIRLASPSYNGGERILRRGYSFVDGIDPATGSAAGGLMFICFQRDPRAQFIPIQRRLAASDALNRHTLHVGSAIFACPPGARPGGFVGEGLFA